MALFESKVADVYNYLSHKVFREHFTASQRLNLKRYASKFELKDGVLYRKAAGKNKIVVSTLAEAISVFGELHAFGNVGHTGIVKTRHAVSSRFYWPGMSKHIEKWVSTCEACRKVGGMLHVDPVQRSIKLGELGKGAGKGGGGDGVIREAGGAFVKKRAAEEEEEGYFRQKEQKRLASLKKYHQEEIDHHKKEIERLQKEIERHKKKIRELNDDHD